MYKISEKIYTEGDNTIIKHTFDGNGMIQDAAYAREVAPHQFGNDKIHLGNVDLGMLTIWLKEAGVEWTDTEGMQEVIKRKLLDGEFSKLRGDWKGKW